MWFPTPRLNRFFAFHVIAVPLVLMILVFLHIVALHEVGSNNPDGVDIDEHVNWQGKPLDGIRISPLLHRQGYSRCRRVHVFLSQP